MFHSRANRPQVAEPATRTGPAREVTNRQEATDRSDFRGLSGEEDCVNKPAEKYRAGAFRFPAHVITPVAHCRTAAL
jgi:hypothetical protein